MPVKTWSGTPPATCDLCPTSISTEFVDGRVRGGSSWAILCPDCHARYGVGIGTGLGQRYRFNPESELWEKVEG